MVAGPGVDDDESYIREQISAGNAVIMEGMVNASDVQPDNDDGDDDARSSQPLVPYVGMTFDTVDNATAYYNKYAFSHGFGIRTSPSKDNEARGPQKLIGRTFSCVHA
ncbi:Protein FAR1-RELATED SEQUENCE 5 [Hordeum vulgare]|nr:Protein FAR1-RELATED SEQUENCE 5 [Hordeum vulgare]